MVTFVTCWYELQSKYDKDSYERWIDNFLSNVNNFNLVIFTNKHSYHMVEHYRENPKIRIVLRELEEFYNYLNQISEPFPILKERLKKPYFKVHFHGNWEKSIIQQHMDKKYEIYFCDHEH